MSIFDDSSPSSEVLTLSAFATRLSNRVHSSPELMGVWVTAELSDLRINGGHCYMELVEKNGSGQTVAKMRATIWQSIFTGIRRQFFQTTGKDIATGMKVMLRGNASHHSLYGLSFNVTDIDPRFTLGDIERIRREILNRLKQEGIIDLNRQLELEPVAQRIAVISAPGAAGYGDFINQLKNNGSGIVFYPVLIPAVMQGERTVSSVIEALDFIESTIDVWDCVAILRGGGATTDLIWFDNYELARRIASFPLPVIVGIGHERDRTVLDEIAHTRVKTPTAAASFLINEARNAYDKTLSLAKSVSSYVSERILGEKARIAALEASLPALVNLRITRENGKLNREFSHIPAIVQGKIAGEKSLLASIPKLIETLYAGILAEQKKKHRYAIESIGFSAIKCLEASKSNLDRMNDMLTVLSPQNTLKRGYSIVRINGKAIKKATDVRKDDKVSIRLNEGSIDAKVI